MCIHRVEIKAYKRQYNASNYCADTTVFSESFGSFLDKRTKDLLFEDRGRVVWGELSKGRVVRIPRKYSSLFTTKEHAIANVYFYLSFLLRIIFVKIYFDKLAFTLKHYNLM